MSRNSEEPQRRSVRFDDEDFANQYHPDPVVRRDAARAAGADFVSYETWDEQTSDRDVVREKRVKSRREFTDALNEKHVTSEGIGQATNALYKGMGGSPSPRGERDRWSTTDQKRVAVAEHQASWWVRLLVGDSKPETQQQQQIRNDHAAQVSQEAAKAANDLIADPDHGGADNWFSFLWGSDHQKDPPPRQVAEAPDPQKEGGEDYDVGDLARDLFGFSFGLPSKKDKE
jgi:hypothetical protein